MKRVKRAQTYYDDLNAIAARIVALGNPKAAADLWLHIDHQVDMLADPNHPRFPHRKFGIPDGMRIMQFGFTDNNPNFLPHKYIPQRRLLGLSI